MATLAKVTSEVRIILKFLVASFIIAFSIFIFLKGGQIFKNVFFPTPLPPPEEKFGKLPRIAFPSQKFNSIEYKINTLTGGLPVFADRMIVYKFKKKVPSLVALQTAKNNLKQNGFSENETKISDSIYQWGNKTGENIQLNVQNNNFKINSNLLTNPPSKFSGPAEKQEGAYRTATNFLQGLGIDTSDLEQEKSTLAYLKVVDGKIVVADSQKDAQYGKLNLFQENIGQNYSIYYPGVNESVMQFILRNEDGIPKIVGANFMHFVVDEKNSSSYPIKNSNEAFEDLQKGNAFIFSQNSEAVIDITDVFLGYYIGEENQQYLLPIILFKGKSFLAYVQAIRETSISN